MRCTGAAPPGLEAALPARIQVRAIAAQQAIGEAGAQWRLVPAHEATDAGIGRIARAGIVVSRGFTTRA